MAVRLPATGDGKLPLSFPVSSLLWRGASDKQLQLWVTCLSPSYLSSGTTYSEAIPRLLIGRQPVPWWRCLPVAFGQRRHFPSYWCWNDAPANLKTRPMHLLSSGRGTPVPVGRVQICVPSRLGLGEGHSGPFTPHAPSLERR